MAGAGRWRAMLLVTAATGLCSACDSDDPDHTVAPFAQSRVLPTGIPARALAVLDGPATTVALVFQLGDRVGLLDASDGDLNPAAAEVGVSPMSIAAVDTDGDGSMELATANIGDATLTLLGRTGSGLASIATASLPLRPKHVTGADLDGDGRDEIVATVGLDGEPGAGIEAWRLGAAGLETVVPRWSIEGAFAAATGDVDSDGDVDVIAVVPSAGEVVWATNDGGGRLAEAGRTGVCDAPRAAVVLGDRIAVACRDGLRVVRGGDVDILDSLRNLYDVVSSDFDADGRSDLAAVDMAGDEVVVWLADVDGGWAGPVAYEVGQDPIALVASDLGGDGDVDLVVSAFGTRTVDVLENDIANQ